MGKGGGWGGGVRHSSFFFFFAIFNCGIMCLLFKHVYILMMLYFLVRRMGGKGRETEGKEY